jgi:hypothetical protein
VPALRGPVGEHQAAEVAGPPVWIPVGLIGEKSVAQGAAILGAPDPGHEDGGERGLRAQPAGRHRRHGRGRREEGHRQGQHALFTSFGFSGVPTIVGKHAQTGRAGDDRRRGAGRSRWRRSSASTRPAAEARGQP